MPQRETVVVHGYREFLRACAKAEPDTRKTVRDALRKVGAVVREDATRRFSAIDTGSAHGFKTRVRQRGVAVEQSIRKTTGNRPDYGSLQMRRGLLPAMVENANDTVRAMEHAVDEIADHFERRP